MSPTFPGARSLRTRRIGQRIAILPGGKREQVSLLERSTEHGGYGPPRSLRPAPRHRVDGHSRALSGKPTVTAGQTSNVKISSKTIPGPLLRLKARLLVRRRQATATIRSELFSGDKSGMRLAADERLAQSAKSNPTVFQAVSFQHGLRASTKAAEQWLEHARIRDREDCIDSCNKIHRDRAETTFQPSPRGSTGSRPGFLSRLSAGFSSGGFSR